MVMADFRSAIQNYRTFTEYKNAACMFQDTDGIFKF